LILPYSRLVVGPEQLPAAARCSPEKHIKKVAKLTKLLDLELAITRGPSMGELFMTLWPYLCTAISYI